MLTATYSFVAIHAEQKIVGLMLARLRQSVQSTWRYQEHIDSTVLASSLARLTEFDGYSATRKLERYVIPAMCGSCAEVDRILDELAAFSAAAKCTLTALHDTLRITLEQGCSRRPNIDPPCRLNIDPGRGAAFSSGNCG